MLANVSHELRTPLDIIIGYSQASPAVESESSERQHIHRSAEHLRRLIDDLLDLSRAEVNEAVLCLLFVIRFSLAERKTNNR
jgi:two-component system sensor histidine kinase/response regulator